MTGPAFAIVCTTVGPGAFLKHYAEAVAEASDRVTMIVIPDRKTPAALYAAVDEYRAAGLKIECPDLNEQEQFLASLGAPAGMFPRDTDHRRNVGYLMAWRDGADIMVSVDDDNLPGERWLYEHTQVALGPAEHANLVGCDSGFWNVCELLKFQPKAVCPHGYPVRPRGYPYRKGCEHAVLGRPCEPATCDVAINAGLWLGDPDVDAIARLVVAPHAVKLFASVVLEPDTWAPVNSQNTAVRREVIPAYYFFRSGRFGDIYQGYLAQACAKAMGHAVRFGTPVVRHERNDHDLLRDLELELPDILILDDWLDWLTSLKPAGGGYADAYQWLAEGMLELHNPVFPSMGMQMRSWLKLIRAIGA